MSHLWLWTLWAVLLALVVIATLRMDWLKVWWMDQLRHLPGDTGSDDLDPGMPAERAADAEPGARKPVPHAPRPVGIPRPAAHDIHGHAAALTHHRPAFHRSGSRH
ncbi:hypothetical protein [Roseateles sp. MS654]|uniref:hypothetical protein n=1 Tax=Roseateles sp. MS654 TaxID=3412685 RepID=UPI003C30E77E